MSIHARKNNIFEKKRYLWESKSCFAFPILCLIFLATFSLWSEAGCDRRIDRGKGKALLSSWSPASYELLISYLLFLLLFLSILSFFHCHHLDMKYHIFWPGGRLSWYELSISLFLFFFLLSATGRPARHELLMCVFSSNNKPSLYMIMYTQFLLPLHSLMIMVNNE